VWPTRGGAEKRAQGPLQGDGPVVKDPDVVTSQRRGASKRADGRDKRDPRRQLAPLKAHVTEAYEVAHTSTPLAFTLALAAPQGLKDRRRLSGELKSDKRGSAAPSHEGMAERNAAGAVNPVLPKLDDRLDQARDAGLRHESYDIVGGVGHRLARSPTSVPWLTSVSPLRTSNPTWPSFSS